MFIHPFLKEVFTDVEFWGDFFPLSSCCFLVSLVSVSWLWDLSLLPCIYSVSFLRLLSRSSAYLWFFGILTLICLRMALSCLRVYWASWICKLENSSHIFNFASPFWLFFQYSYYTYCRSFGIVTVFCDSDIFPPKIFLSDLQIG